MSISDHFYKGNGSQPCLSCGQTMRAHAGHEWWIDGFIGISGDPYPCQICGVVGSKHPKFQLDHLYRGNGLVGCQFCQRPIYDHPGHDWFGNTGSGGFRDAYVNNIPCEICGIGANQHEAGTPNQSSPKQVKSLWEGTSSTTTRTPKAGPSISQSRQDRLDRMSGKTKAKDETETSKSKSAKTSPAREDRLKQMESGKLSLSSMSEKQRAEYLAKHPPLRFDQLSPEVQARIRGGSPFSPVQSGQERWDSDGNYLGEFFGGRDFSKMSQKELNQFSSSATSLGQSGQLGPLHSSNELKGHLIDGAALPAEMIPKGYKQTDLIPSDAFKSGTAIPSNALPASVKASALNPNLEIDSSALPASVIPKGYERGDAIPAEAFNRNFAIPSNAIPSNALPAEALPASVMASALPASARIISSALPASAKIPKGYSRGDAIPAEAFPPNTAIPSNAIPSNAIPSNVLQALALPASALKGSLIIDTSKLDALPASLVQKGYVKGQAIPAELFPGDFAIPSNALPAEALPASALPASALPASGLPEAALPAELKAGGLKRT